MGAQPLIFLGAKTGQVLAVNALAASWLLSLSHKPLKLVFLDPPYEMMLEDESRKTVLNILTALPPTWKKAASAWCKRPWKSNPNSSPPDS